MGIQDENQREIIRLGAVHSVVFKISLYAMPIIIGYFVSMVLRHDKEIAVMQEGFTELKSRLQGVSSQIGKLPGQIADKTKPVKDDE